MGHGPKTLRQSDHRVGLVERDGDRCRTLAEDLDITVLQGDGTDIDTLREAGADQAKYVVALTGRDEENLVVCQLAKSCFKAPLTIARVNNPKNQALLKLLGVDATVRSTALAAQMIENALPLNGMRIFSVFQEGEVEIAESEVTAGAPTPHHLDRTRLVVAGVLLLASLATWLGWKFREKKLRADEGPHRS